MMDLQNTLDHKRNTKVMVNGNVYEIDNDGVAKGVKKADAERLLSGSAWVPWGGERPRERLEKAREAKEHFLQLGHEAAEKANKEKGIVEKVKQQLLKEGWTPPAAPPEEDGEEGGEEEPVRYFSEDGESSWTVPAEGEDWPDPYEDMPMDYLHLMADAYEVEYAKNIGKAKLIERIHEEMYGDE